MEELKLVIDLALAVGTAFIGGVIAQRLRQPVILGYLIAGVVLGPFTPGPVADAQTIQILAEIGVTFLMFALGAEFSLGELRSLGRVTVVGGALQIILTMGLGPLLAPLLGLTLVQGLFLGALIALSSTVVALKVLMGRGELGALHGRVALGILIVQDLAVVPMVIVLPALAGGSATLLTDLAGAGAKALAILVGAYLVGTKGVPFVLRHVAGTRTRELFLLGVVALALGTALTTQAAGLSLAFGAFLAGLVISESEYRTQVVAEVLPLRDLFASLFFVSVGMLINPLALLNQAGMIIGLAAVVIVGKALITTGVVRALGMPGRVALLAGLSLAQVGEFSFVLARIGVEGGTLPASLFDLILAIALVSIILTPALLGAANPLLRGLRHLPGVRAWFAEPQEAATQSVEQTPHAVICGYGRVGQELAAALDECRYPYLVIEYNPLVVRALRERGVAVIYGDAGNPAVLEHAGLERALVMAVLTSDASSAELAVRHAHAQHPALPIVARSVGAVHIAALRQAGASEVVQPEFEAGLLVIQQTLQHFGLDEQVAEALAANRRAAFYEPGPVGEV